VLIARIASGCNARGWLWPDSDARYPVRRGSFRIRTGSTQDVVNGGWTHYRLFAECHGKTALVAIRLPEQLRQPHDVDGDPSRLVLGEHLRLPGLGLVLSRIEVRERLLDGAVLSLFSLSCLRNRDRRPRVFFLRRRWLRVRCAPACNKERANAVIQPNPTFPTGAPILEFRRRKLNLFKGR
jgi:hypothetical protein